MTAVAARVLVPGAAAGPTLTLDAPLSFWGGVDPATGVIVEPRHPQVGTSLAGRILVLPAARGSSSSSSVLAELLRMERAPLGIVLGERDEILAIGAVVGAELYGASCPVVVVGPRDYPGVRGAAWLAIAEDGTVTVGAGPSETPAVP